MPLTLNFQVVGSGEPVVILHGLFGSLTNWQQVAKQLATQYQVYSVDLRNHGQSPHDHSMHYTDMVADLELFLRSQSIADVHLIGHSMGGKVAMQYSLAHSEQVSSLTVVDIAPVQYHHDFNDIIAGLKAIDLEALTGRQQAVDVLAPYVKPLGLRQFLLQNLVSNNGQYQWRINISAIEHEITNIGDFPDVDGAYLGPTLFVKGEDSDYVLPEYEAQINQWFPHAQIEGIAEAGHWVHAEQPKLFMQALLSFL
ncbi:MAG: alpha/beta fold hydrolase [Methylococcales bacterium]|jgi:esterase|nr:alpha/beta fold hydrolase [Methylococcales bacterium]